MKTISKRTTVSPVGYVALLVLVLVLGSPLFVAAQSGGNGLTSGIDHLRNRMVDNYDIFDEIAKDMGYDSAALMAARMRERAMLKDGNKHVPKVAEGDNQCVPGCISRGVAYLINRLRGVNVNSTMESQDPFDTQGFYDAFVKNLEEDGIGDDGGVYGTPEQIAKAKQKTIDEEKVGKKITTDPGITISGAAPHGRQVKVDDKGGPSAEDHLQLVERAALPPGSMSLGDMVGHLLEGNAVELRVDVPEGCGTADFHCGLLFRVLEWPGKPDWIAITIVDDGDQGAPGKEGQDGFDPDADPKAENYERLMIFKRVNNKWEGQGKFKGQKILDAFVEKCKQ